MSSSSQNAILAAAILFTCEAGAYGEGPFLSLAQGNAWVYKYYNNSQGHTEQLIRTLTMDTLYSSGPYFHFQIMIQDSGISIQPEIQASGRQSTDTVPLMRLNRDTGWVRPDSLSMQGIEGEFFLYYFTVATDPFHPNGGLGKSYPGPGAGQYFLSHGDTLLYCERYEFTSPGPTSTSQYSGRRYFQSDLGLLRYTDRRHVWNVAESTSMELIRFNGINIDHGFIERAESSFIVGLRRTAERRREDPEPGTRLLNWGVLRTPWGPIDIRGRAR